MRQSTPNRISYHVRIALGCLGWLLLAYPRSSLLYRQIASGDVADVVLHYRAVGARALSVAPSLLPICALLFLASLYLDAAGKIGVILRCVLSGVCAAALLATARIVWRVPGVWGVVGLAQSLAWIPLMVVFAVRRAPLSATATRGAAGLIVFATVFTMCVHVLGYIAMAGARLSYSTSVLLQLSAWLLIVLFAAGVRREALAARRREVAW